MAAARLAETGFVTVDLRSTGKLHPTALPYHSVKNTSTRIATKEEFATLKTAGDDVATIVPYFLMLTIALIGRRRISKWSAQGRLSHELDGFLAGSIHTRSPVRSLTLTVSKKWLESETTQEFRAREHGGLILPLGSAVNPAASSGYRDNDTASSDRERRVQGDT
ncbi:hypothetical protein BV25DRAFT_1897075 [Artomyces pyxidatus]|uniref:Uncharacterized protein n=1 Tax=Artomyces pyxidatus TaxID=48021 RepID=A0ACB8TGE0_9AGAM|nr:hypothetical protein BV25DRAFT_1897075 [Artomyces pyxidatus]